MKLPDTPYDQSFYDGLQTGMEASALVVAPIVRQLTGAKSVIDIGCGQGMWLSVFERLGVSDTLGVDGSYVDRARLCVAAERFRAADLGSTTSLDVGRRFDLVVSLEVAEHLSPSSAPGFVDLLTSLGDCVMFSAAVPGQEGTLHVNEQWPEYWSRLFDARGYSAADCIRKRVWNNPDVAWWYAQNIVLYVNRDTLPSMRPELQAEAARSGGPPLALVHPGMFRQFRDHFDSLLASPRVLLKSLPRALASAVRRRVHRSKNGAVPVRK